MRAFDRRTTGVAEERLLADLKELRNQLATASEPQTLAFEQLPPLIPPMPLKVQIQTTTRCNAACTMCPYPEITSEDGFEHGQMSDSLFSTILSQLRGWPVERLSLFLMNEPLLDVRLEAWLKASREALPGTVLGLFSNGSALTPKRARQVADAGLDELCISVHGFDKEQYESVMQKLSFDRLQKNLSAVVDLHRAGELGSLHLQIVTGDLPELTEALEALDPRLREYVLVKGFSNEREVVGVEKGLASSGTKRGEDSTPLCQRPFVKLYVLTSGECVLCNVDWRGSVSLGRIGEGPGESIQEIWQGKRYQEIRVQHLLASFEQGLLCQRCDYAAVVDDE